MGLHGQTNFLSTNGSDFKDVHSDSPNNAAQPRLIAERRANEFSDADCHVCRDELELQAQKQLSQREEVSLGYRE